MRLRLRFSHKILLMPALAGVSFLLMLLVGQASGHSDARLLAEVRDRQVPALELGREVEITIEAIIRSLQDAVIASEADDLAEVDALVGTLRERLRVAQVNAGSKIPELAEWASALESYYPLARDVSERLIAGENGGPLEGAIAEMGSRQAALRACVERCSLRRRRELDAAFGEAEATRSASLRTMTLILVTALFLLAALSAVVIRSTISGLRAAVRAAEGLARGELDVPIPAGRADEVGQVLAAVGTVIAYMREIAAVADGIAHGGRQAHAAVNAARGAFGTAFRRMVDADARYRHLVDSSHAIVWTACPQSLRLTFVSSGVESVLGYPAEQWVEEPSFWQDRMHPDDRARIPASLRAAARDGRDLQFECRMGAADGRLVWLRGSMRVVADDGEAREIVGVMLDITDEKRAEMAVVESERRYRSLLANIPDVAWTSASDGSTAFIGANVEKVYGFTSEEILADGHGLWIGRIHPDDVESVLRSFNALFEGGREFDIEYRIQKKDGSWMWVHDRALGTYERDGVRYADGIFSDITERKRVKQALVDSEQRYRLIFADSPLPSWVADRDTLRLLDVNDAAVRHYGYSRDELLAMSLEDLRPAEDVAALIEGWARPRTPIATMSRRHRKKDGSIIDVEVTSQDTEFQGHRARIALLQDVTERKRLEEQLRQSQKMEAVGQLAGGVAHDFNNMLNVITGYGELAAKKLPEGHPTHRHLREILKAANRSAALTRQLLAFSRKQVLEPKVLDLNGVVAEMDKMLRRLIGEDVRLVSSPTQGLGHVKADPGQIEQVLLNLAVNARDAMPKGGTLVLETANVILDGGYARTHADAHAGPHVMLAVSDTGHGMDAQTVHRIFEPFFTTKPEGRGTGLGLSTVYGIVRQSGGHIAVYSELGRGTTFKVYLPRIDREAEAAETLVASPPTSGTETILLVEDEGALREMVREILESSGYRVLECNGPEEALAVAVKHPAPIELTLTDVVMPGMSGRELAERLKALQPKARILYMSGYTDDAIGHLGLLDEGTHFIQKPFTSADLLRKVRDVVGGPAAGLPLVPESARVA